MAETISVAEWIGHLDKDYLSTFIKDGGSAIKFAVTDDEHTRTMKDLVRSRGEELGYLVVDIDAENSRFHMPQDIFFSMASQVDWRLTARKIILRLAEELNYRTNDIDATSDGNVYEAIGNASNMDAGEVLTTLRPGITRSIFRNRSMSKDFRVAMFHLCSLEGTSGDHIFYGGQPIIDWLTGSNTRVTSVRPFSIYNTVNRTTAKYFLESALYWFHYVGFTGTLMMLDNSRVTVIKRPTDGSRYYTRPMALESYQLLREFIDSAERMTATMMLTISTGEFLNVESDPRSRGIGAYQALQTRIMDDVKDRNLINPVASLVRLA